MENKEEEKFNENLKEIKELSLKLKEPLKEPFNKLYHNKEANILKYQGELKDYKYEGRGILYEYSGKIEYKGFFKNNEYNGFGNEYYYYNGKLKYEGYFLNGKRHGKGILYYYSSDAIYFNGIFDKSNYIEGIIYEPNGNKIYQGTFINNIPKEGKNIKLYNIYRNLVYQGDLVNGQYEGKGTLYKETSNSNYYLFYEGDFKNNNFEGNGKMFYHNKIIFYDGQFKNNMISGEGIQFYKNKNIKIKGKFENNKCISGEYYSPDGTKIYEGSFLNGIPKESNKIIIYNNNGFKVYEGKIMNGKFEGQGIEYCPVIQDKILYEGIFTNDLYVLPDLDINISKDEKFIKYAKIYLLPKGDLPGKTCFLYRLRTNEFRSNGIITIGLETTDINFVYKNQDYKLIFVDVPSQDRFIPITLTYIKDSTIVIYMLDITKDKLDFSLIDKIKERNEKVKIYVVGNKLDLIDEIERITEDYYERLNVDDQINKNKIDKFFLISVKTGEGIDKLMSSIKMDSLIYIKSCEKLTFKKSKKKQKEKCNIY